MGSSIYLYSYIIKAEWMTYTGMATVCFVFITSAPIWENEFDRQGEEKQQKGSTK